jgi:hypothetical protein
MKKKTRRTFRFGKYKGTPVNDVIEKDPDYCRWLCERFDSPVFTERELSHLNRVWKRLHGTWAVMTPSVAENTVYEGSVREFAGKKLKDIRTTDLKSIREAGPACADAIDMAIFNRRRCREIRTMHRRPAPVFQTDDI